MIWGMRGQGRWSDRRGSNLLDGGAHFYDTYEAADGKWIAVGRDRATILCRLAPRHGAGRRRVGRAIRAGSVAAAETGTRPIASSSATRDDWVAAFEGHEACVAPVLGFDEADAAPAQCRARHLRDGRRGDAACTGPALFRQRDGARRGPGPRRDDGAAILAEAGLSEAEIAALDCDAGGFARPYRIMR